MSESSELVRLVSTEVIILTSVMIASTFLSRLLH